MENQLLTYLTPYLPYLVKGVKLAGQELAKKLGEKAGEQGWKNAQRIWEKLQPRLTSPAAQEALQDAASAPEDQDALAALRLQLKKALQADPALLRELTALLPADRGGNVTAGGDRSVAIGGNASGNIIITGDNNKV